MDTALAEAPVSTLYAPSEPVDLRRTVAPLRRGAGDPTFATTPDGCWRAISTPQGPATLRLVQRGAAVSATAWGSGASWAIDSVPELLGAGDDWSDLDVSRVPILHETRRRLQGLRLTRSNLVFEALLGAVFEQKVTVVEAHRAWRYLVLKYGTVAPGPAPAGLRVFPSAEVWRRIPSWEWHRAGVGPQRSDTAMRIAKVADSLERTLALGRGGAEVHRALRSIPGVGVWTAAETTMRAHGDPDAVSVGDYHLAAFVGYALTGSRVDDDGMLELLEPWRGQRQRVVRLLESSGFAKPRFGPRMTIQDHRRH